ncbi:MAG: hypothetical protein P4L51_24265 [Puia sp.]|nr:hypothetical protein [Puia sp.]
MNKKQRHKVTTKKKTKIFRDIKWLPKFAQALDSYAENSRNQITALEMGMYQPYDLDDNVLDITIQLYREGLEQYPLNNSQINHWLKQDLNQDQRAEVERLVEVNEIVRARNERILDLCNQVKHGTIDRVMEDDDYEIALDAFAGKIRLELSGSMDERFETAKEIHEFIEAILAGGGDDSDIVNHPEMMNYALKLQGLICSAEPGEFDGLAQMLHGFGRFAKILENMLELFKQFK